MTIWENIGLNEEGAIVRTAESTLFSRMTLEEDKDDMRKVILKGKFDRVIRIVVERDDHERHFLMTWEAGLRVIKAQFST